MMGMMCGNESFKAIMKSEKKKEKKRRFLRKVSYSPTIVYTVPPGGK